MAIASPIPGLVIRYSYLWHAEFKAGREGGVKDRPAAIIAAIIGDPGGVTRVLVLPITHTPPDPARMAIEIPAAASQRLGLDDARSWIVVDESNEFVWPGPDLARVPSDAAGGMAYGFLPPRLFAQVRRAFITAVESRKLARVPRNE